MDVKGPAHLEQRQQRFSVGYAIAVIIALVVIQSLFSGPHTENLSYSDFKKLVTSQKVTDLVLEDRTITGTLVSKGLEGMLPAEKIAELQRYGGGEHRFVTTRVDDPDLTRELMAANVRFTGRVDNPWFSVLLGWLLPALLFFGLWGLIMRSMHGQHAGMMAIGKSKARVYVERSTGVSFEDVAGIDEARGELFEATEEARRALKDDAKALSAQIVQKVLGRAA